MNGIEISVDRKLLNFENGYLKNKEFPRGVGNCSVERSGKEPAIDVLRLFAL